MNIDFKKMLKEDEGFRRYCAEAYVKAIFEINDDLIKMFKGFYDMGMSTDQVAEFIKTTMRLME